MNCPNINCKERNKDILCTDMYDNCRIYGEYFRKSQEESAAKKEADRQIQENDIGLVARLESLKKMKHIGDFLVV